MGDQNDQGVVESEGGMNIIDDSIDFSAFLAEPEAKQKVKPASAWQDETIRYMHAPDEQQGVYLPWSKTSSLFRLRSGELTLWPGINGHGKSILLSQLMLCAASQGEKVLVASMEMRPKLTLERKVRQACKEWLPSPSKAKDFFAWSADRLWLYDHLGSVQWKQLIAVMRYCASTLGITQFVIDSLMRCGIREDDYSGQKDFVDALCTFKHYYDVHVHLVMHSRKKDDEMTPPGKFDAKGTGTITDLADNVVTVWRNKKKESEAQRAEGLRRLDVMEQPDALLICDKQRNFPWEGRVMLWYRQDCMQFVESSGGAAIELMEWGA